jgi:hypothetical protein
MRLLKKNSLFFLIEKIDNMQMNPEDLSTLVSCLNKARRDGYTAEFTVSNDAIKAPDANHVYRAGDIRVSNFYRFEGVSDPADSAILYLIETNDGKKGTLLDAYGIYADPQISRFMDKVKEVSKKMPSARLNIFRMPLSLAFFSLLIGILAVIITPAGRIYNPVLTAIGITLAVIYTVWIIIEVVRARHLLFYQRMFWLILTVSVPFFGALLYQIMHQRQNLIVS